MPTRKSPRKGSLQYWPRKRAKKFLPSVNWQALKSDLDSTKIKGLIGYKVGMFSAKVKDNTSHSMTKDKEIVVPVTAIEVPPMKIFSVRFYKNNKVAKDFLNVSLEKELKKKIKIPKKNSLDLEKINLSDYDDLTMVIYSQVKKTSIKKTPDLSEIGLSGNMENKLKFVKEHLNKEILVSEVFEKGNLVDVRGLTTGRGLSGPVKRFGLKLKPHKSEKGRRRPGSLGPWHPARVTFRVPQAGQLGMFTRIVYNNKILDMDSGEKLENVKNFGNVKTDYVLILGSVQGPSKRQLLLTSSLRPTKKQLKKNYEFIKLLR